uniref:Uncharacterized protein n=1 Tax=Erythrolobus madagascarensis TaxID=708628 RepID=A0A7S0T7W0_9RHOD
MSSAKTGSKGGGGSGDGGGGRARGKGKIEREEDESSSEYETDDDEVEVVTQELKKGMFERELSEPDDDEIADEERELVKGKKQSLLSRTFSRNGSSASGSNGGLIRTLSRSFSKGSQSMSRTLSRAASSGGTLVRSLSRQSFTEVDVEEAEAAAAATAKSEAYKAISSKKAVQYSAPTFLFAPYGLSPAMNVIAIFHNGIRQELKNAYHLLSVMDRMFATLTHDEINMFFDYWEVLWTHVEDFFDAEEKTLWPSVEGRAKEVLVVDALTHESRGKEKAKLVLFHETLTKDMSEKYALMPASEALKNARYEINRAVSRLLDYFMVVEKTVPKILQEKFKERELVSIEKAMLGYMITNGRCVWANAHIPIRWQNDAERYQELVGRHFPKLKMLDFKRWQKTFEKQHESILKSLTALSKDTITATSGGRGGQGEMVPQFYLEKARRKAAGLDSDSEAEEVENV